MLWLLQQFIDNEILYRAIGMSYPAFHTGIIAFGMVYSPISTLVGIFTNYQSRKNEYEADEYAAKTYSGKVLANALKKLTVDSFSNPFPHPLEVAISFSHPTTIQRIEKLEKT
jgi:STE24 endopeptidase